MLLNFIAKSCAYKNECPNRSRHYCSKCRHNQEVYSTTVRGADVPNGFVQYEKKDRLAQLCNRKLAEHMANNMRRYGEPHGYQFHYRGTTEEQERCREIAGKLVEYLEHETGMRTIPLGRIWGNIG